MRKFLMVGLLAMLALFAVGCGSAETPAAPVEQVEEAEIVVEAGGDSAEAMAEPAVEEAAIDEVVAEEAANELLIYAITPEKSLVRFELDEDLRGEHLTVVGSTNQVSGEIALNQADLGATEVSPIVIDAGTLETDNNFRNRAIRSFILNTGTYNTITFVPKAVEGLPETAVAGDEISFTIAGELTIRDVVQPVTFDVVATLVSDSEMNGTASTTINRADYGLQIPNAPGVANVEEEVDLYIDFVANAS